MSSPAVVAAIGASAAAAVAADAPAAESPVVDADLALIRSLVRSHADFPSPGINFRDIFPVFQSPRATRLLLTRLTSLIQSSYSPLPDVVVGLDSRGFLFGPSMALGLDAAFVPVRKAGKLPGATHQVTYTTEYSKATTEIQVGAITKGQRVVIVDDLLATVSLHATTILTPCCRLHEAPRFPFGEELCC
jgi:adenine phosphoribosyltransferase